jgi:hypothetical protein
MSTESARRKRRRATASLLNDYLNNIQNTEGLNGNSEPESLGENIDKTGWYIVHVFYIAQNIDHPIRYY